MTTRINMKDAKGHTATFGNIYEMCIIIYINVQSNLW